MQVPTCRLCESDHWSYEPHVLKGVSVRPMAKALLAKPPKPIPTTPPPPVAPNFRSIFAKTPDKPRTETADKCVCGKALVKPERGPAPKFCGDTCRKRAKRATR